MDNRILLFINLSIILTTLLISRMLYISDFNQQLTNDLSSLTPESYDCLHESLRSNEIAKNMILAQSSISIVSDDDFESQAINNGWLGNGSSSNPYLIENLTLSSTNSVSVIYIRNTRVFFVLKNINITGGSEGILLENTTNGIITDISVSFASNTAIYLYSSENINISDNSIHNNKNGFLVDYSKDIHISKSKISNNDLRGIHFRDSNNSTIFDNQVYENTNNGIMLSHSEHVSVINNTSFDNNYRGILVEGESSYIKILNNTIYENEEAGLSVVGGSCINITENIFYANKMVAIRFMGDINRTECTKNNFIDNSLKTSLPQASIEKIGVKFNKNYWSDWTGPDDDQNGIVDLPYIISYDSDINDNFPQVKAYYCKYLHILTEPVIIFPNNWIILSGETNVKWGAASDTWGYKVTYNVYCSSNNGTNWELLVQDIIKTNYLWNTSTIADGFEYRLKIESNNGFGQIRYDISDSIFEIHNIPLSTEESKDPDRSTSFGELIIVITNFFLLVLLKKRKSY